MYANLFFLILMLLLVDIGPQLGPNIPIINSTAVIASYLLILGLIVFQNLLFSKSVRGHRSRMLMLANFELILYFCLFYFYFGGSAILLKLPMVGHSKLLAIMLTFVFYFLGLMVFHVSALLRSGFNFVKSLKKSSLELLMLLPFIFPVLLLTLLREYLAVASNSYVHQALSLLFGEKQETFYALFGSALFLTMIMILLPFVIKRIWQCYPLDKGPLLTRLENLCLRARTKHAGILVWTVMENSITAAVIGIVPRFRYLLFTPRMLNEMQPEWVEAVLCHELGHCYRKHLYLYPFILSGMAVCGGLFSLYFSDALFSFIWAHTANGSALQTLAYPLAIFLPYALIIGLYFRVVFGFYSRLFERQADLHVFKMGLDPIHLIAAFNHMGSASINGKKAPSWHHFSIQERIDYLELAIKNPSEIERFHRYVNRMLFLYFVFLAIMSVILYIE